MKVNLKFMGVDLLDSMSAIVERHTEHYKTDFYTHDRNALREAAQKHGQDERRFLWLCRDSGTWLLNERSVFLRNTFEYNTFVFYAENHMKGIYAYAVELDVADSDSLTGNLYALNYERYVSHVLCTALTPETIVLNYEYGSRVVSGENGFTAYPDAEYGSLVSHVYHPESEDELDYLLRLERKHREQFALGNFAPYLESL